MNYSVLSTLCGKQIFASSPIIKQGFTSSNYGPSTTGAILAVDDVYSICQGTVVSVAKDRNSTYVVTVQYGSDKWFRYCNLSSAEVKYNKKVQPHTFIGHAYRNEVRFEYCNLEKSQYPVRIANITCYKHDPLGILYGLEELHITPDTVYVPSDEMTVVSVKPLTNYEDKLSSIMNSSGR